MQETKPPVDAAEAASTLKEFFRANNEAALTAKMDKRLRQLEAKGHTFVRRRKVGRNEPCPCGSGKKFKHCHLLSAR